MWRVRRGSSSDAFHLEYEPGTHASLLNSFSLEGRCEESVAEQSNGRLTPTTCPRLPPLSFEYQRVQGSALLHDEQGLEFARFSTTVREVERARRTPSAVAPAWPRSST